KLRAQPRLSVLAFHPEEFVVHRPVEGVGGKPPDRCRREPPTVTPRRRSVEHGQERHVLSSPFSVRTGSSPRRCISATQSPPRRKWHQFIRRSQSPSCA